MSKMLRIFQILNVFHILRTYLKKLKIIPFLSKEFSLRISQVFAKYFYHSVQKGLTLFPLKNPPF